MNPNIFIDDFELTENMEVIHAILGRSLIIATRFDNLCNHTEKYLQLKTSFSMILSGDEFEFFVDAIFDKFSSLNKSIKHLPIGQIEKDILHNARKARNEIAHSLSMGMTGCLDTKVDKNHLESNVSLLIAVIASADFLISTMLSILNDLPLVNYTESHYKQKMVDWVLGK